jgi:N-acetylglucosaminyl-diphospho-decaprenol L-rhamnosyltransferase
MTGEPTVAVVVVVSFEPPDMLAACLESVRETAPVETVVVDNGSREDSIALVRERFPAARLVVNERNRGYGAAANQGIFSCSAPAVLLLNTDTLLEPDAIAVLGRYLAENPRAAIVGPRLANADGTLQRSTYPFPSVADTLLGETGLHLLVRRAPLIRRLSLRTWNHDAARRVAWVLGAALAIRRSAFEAVGGFDEDFFMYGDEVDLCRRLSAAGFETHFAPATTVTHLGGASTATRASEMRREFLVSKRRYLVRHESPRAASRILWIMRAVVLARVLRDAVRLRLAGESEDREQLRQSIDDSKALLRDRGLWKP